MATTLKRLFWLSLLGGAGYAGWTVWNSRQSDDAGSAPEWPPLDPPTPADTTADSLPDSPGETVAETVAETVTASGFATLPVDPTDADATDADATDADSGSHVTTPAAGSPRWVAPIDGACPPGYAIKANDNSGIYHVPGGRFYDRTVPERCYATTDDAAADGYRPAKA